MMVRSSLSSPMRRGSRTHLFFPDRHDMRAGTEQRGLVFDFVDVLQQSLAFARMGPQAIKVLCQPARPLDAGQFLQPEARLAELGGEFIGPVEVCSSEIFRLAGEVTVLPVTQIAFENRSEVRLIEKAVRQGIEQRSESADCDRKHDAADSQDPKCLLQTSQAITPFRQMVQRAQ